MRLEHGLHLIGVTARLSFRGQGTALATTCFAPLRGRRLRHPRAPCPACGLPNGSSPARQPAPYLRRSPIRPRRAAATTARQHHEARIQEMQGHRGQK
eukprot:7258418-Prymnesium_polylepis.1